jgi:hypothetical protein
VVGLIWQPTTSLFVFVTAALANNGLVEPLQDVIVAKVEKVGTFHETVIRVHLRYS